MKITFEFDTDVENFDFYELERYKNVDKMAVILETIREKIRSFVKYDERESISKDELEDIFWEIIKDEGFSFEDIGY